MKTLRTAPLFKSAAWKAFLVLQAFPALYLFMAAILASGNSGRDPMAGVFTALIVEAVLVVCLFILFRIEKRGWLG